MTLDREPPTNRFHALYIFLVPVMAAFPEFLVTPIHLSLTILALFAAATIVLLFKLLAEFPNPWNAVLGAGVFTLNPYVVVMGSDELETSLRLFFAMLVLWADFKWIKRTRHLSPPKFFRLELFVDFLYERGTEGEMKTP